MSSGAWGSGNYGAGSWGGGVGPLSLESAKAIRENVLRLTFTTTLYYSSILDPEDTSNPEKFLVTPVSGTYGIDGEATRPVTAVRIGHPTVDDGILPGEVGRVFDITLDRAMTSYPGSYLVEIVDVYSTDLTLTYSGSIEIPALFKQIVPPQFQTGHLSRDIANPQTLRGALAAGIPFPDATAFLGTWRTDDTGDYAFDEGSENLRKRIMRRLITRKHAFAHLPGYGVGIPDLGKQLGVAARLASVQADAESQIREEPDVADVKVTILVDPSIAGLVRVRVFARPKQGAPLNFEVPFKYPRVA